MPFKGKSIPIKKLAREFQLWEHPYQCQICLLKRKRTWMIFWTPEGEFFYIFCFASTVLLKSSANTQPVYTYRFLFPTTVLLIESLVQELDHVLASSTPASHQISSAVEFARVHTPSQDPSAPYNEGVEPWSSALLLFMACTCRSETVLFVLCAGDSIDPDFIAR